MDDPTRAYIDRVSDDRRALLGRLRALLLAAFPEAQEVLWWSMPTYRVGNGWVTLGYRLADDVPAESLVQVARHDFGPPE